MPSVAGCVGRSDRDLTPVGPYWAQRSYQDGGAHYAGQIGDEANPRAYVEDLLACTREWLRVLKPTGSLFVNLGDKYGERAGPGRAAGEDQDNPTYRKATRPARRQAEGVRPKSLIGTPWRYALGCVDELGLILRAEIVWNKPNGLPESVADRVRRSHETWFHLVKQPRYYSAMDELREPHAPVSLRRAMPHRSPAGRRGPEVYDGLRGQTLRLDQANHPLGRLPGSVWEVATEPLIVPAVSPIDGLPLPDHFAAFPTAWPRRFILGFCPEGICGECGDGRSGDVCSCNEPIATPLGSSGGADPTLTTGRAGFNRERAGDAGRRVLTRYEQRHYAAQLRESPHRAAMKLQTGEAAWGHYVRTDRTGARPVPPDLLDGWLASGWLTEPPPFEAAPTVPAVVLDPFGGTGTVALVADVLGRVGISGDLSHDYGRLARWRTSDPGERARAMQVDKPPAQVTDQEALW